MLSFLVRFSGGGEVGGEDAVFFGRFGDGEGFCDGGWWEVETGRIRLVVDWRLEEGEMAYVDLSASPLRVCLCGILGGCGVFGGGEVRDEVWIEILR